MYDHARIVLIIVAKEMSSHCCVIVMFDVKLEVRIHKLI